MSGIYEQMLQHYNATTSIEQQNAVYEVVQQIALAGLYKGGFFDKAAFYGGTCLRLFHNLPRFSEDMDFSLLKADENFNFENYFQPIIDEFDSLGRRVEILKKSKQKFSRVDSAFLKDNTDVYNLKFQSEKSVKIKIEVDTKPPMNFETEHKYLQLPYTIIIRCFTLPDLYAGKMHALAFRHWHNRVKGRDWYDFEWYVRYKIPLDFKHLQERIKEFNNKEMTKEEFQTVLKQRLATTDIESVKNDVRPFVVNPKELDIWTNDYFLQLADRIIYK